MSIIKKILVYIIKKILVVYIFIRRVIAKKPKTQSNKVVKAIRKNDIKKNFQLKFELDTINNSTKTVIISVGENGSGKTTAVFRMAKYFLSSHENISCVDLDLYKRNHKVFNIIAREYNVSNITPPSNENFNMNTAMSNAISNFSKSESTMLIVDTSGRRANDINLHKEICTFLDKTQKICKDNNINSFVCIHINAMKINGLEHNLFFKNEDNYDFISLNHIDKHNINKTIIDFINQYGHKVMFLNTKDEILIYSKEVLADFIKNK